MRCVIFIWAWIIHQVFKRLVSSQYYLQLDVKTKDKSVILTDLQMALTTVLFTIINVNLCLQKQHGNSLSESPHRYQTLPVTSLFTIVQPRHQSVIKIRLDSLAKLLPPNDLYFRNSCKKTRFRVSNHFEYFSRVI